MPPARIVAIVACLATAATLGGCRNQFQFSGMMYYGNLVTEARAAEIQRVTLDQLADRAAAIGLRVAQRDTGRIVFRTQLPDWAGTGPDGEPMTRPDTRQLTVEVVQGRDNASRSYRYNATIRGTEPAGFTPEARANLGLALLAVREIFEMPLETDFFPRTGG